MTAAAHPPDASDSIQPEAGAGHVTAKVSIWPMPGVTCSGGRNRRHFADVQTHVLTGRSGASSSESRPSAVGHERAFVKLGSRMF
jgi:hypothetical protein